MATAFFKGISRELGVGTLLNSPRDSKILCIQRFVRLFAYGSSTLVLALFLAELDVSTYHIGLFMTLTLLGDVALSFLLTLFADGLGRRRILTAGALLMTGSGVVFTFSSSFWILVLASVFGVISPSGNEIGPFRAIEESTLAQLTPREVRSEMFAWYTLIGSAGAAIGTLVAGGIVEILNAHYGWTLVGAYRAIFVLYSILGLIKTFLALILSSACEAERQPDKGEYQQVSQEPDENDHLTEETDARIEDDHANNVVAEEASHPEKPALSTRIAALVPSLSATSRSIVWKLCLLFGIDSFAGGLVPASWLTYYFTMKFHISSDVLGTIFFVSNLVTSASGLAASSLAKRIGLVKTMVFTHVPASVFLALIPVPTHRALAVTFLILRASLASMDQAPRQAFLAMAVLPNERTAVMGIVNVVKTFASSGGPVVTGKLGSQNRFWIVFLLAGGLKITYDFAMLALFIGFRGREEEESG